MLAWLPRGLGWGVWHLTVFLELTDRVVQWLGDTACLALCPLSMRHNGSHRNTGSERTWGQMGGSHDHWHIGHSQCSPYPGGYCGFLPCLQVTQEGCHCRSHFTDEEVESDDTAGPSTAPERCLTWGVLYLQTVLKVFKSLERALEMVVGIHQRR